VTELTQPLAAAPSGTQTKAMGHPEAPGSPVTFSELVYAHFEWWRALRDGTLDDAGAAKYHRALERFEHRHGELVSAYWCTHVESAVALTQRKSRLPWGRPIASFHRESDWATKGSPDIARELHRCDELAVRARTVLTGVRRLICMQLVVASASHLLSLVDRRAGHLGEADGATALEEERKALDRAEEYYRDAANGQAQIVYFMGMAFVAIVIAICAAVWLTLDWASPVAALAAGALGAVVSVIQRINAGKFRLEYDVGRPYAMFLGGLRPLIGGAFAVVISFAVDGGLLHLPIAADSPSAHKKLALLAVGFVAGFSERWAQDTLAAALPVGKAEKPAKPA
jgi:hypothetical protein